MRAAARPFGPGERRRDVRSTALDLAEPARHESHPRPGARVFRPDAGLVVALGAIAACVLIDARWLRIGLDDLDEGYFVEQATRVLHGQLPYRDFESLYTPGLVYLHAALFAAAGGPTLIGMRLASLAARALLAGSMYLVGRSLTPGGWAAVWPPVFLLVGLDTIPAGWEPHPGWYAALGSVAVVAAINRVPTAAAGRRWRWLVAAGALAAATFALKQNVGVLISLAVVELTLLRGFGLAPELRGAGPTPDLRGAGVAPGLGGAGVTPAVAWLRRASVVGIVCLVVWLVHPYLDPSVALLVVAPVLSTSLLLLVSAAPVSADGIGLVECLQPLLPFAAGWLLVTLPWLTLLGAGLDWQLGQLRAFVGVIDQAALYTPAQLPGPAALAAVALSGVLLVAARQRRAAPRIGLLLAGCLALGITTIWLTRQADEPPVASVLLAPERIGAGLVTLVPAVAAWGAGWLLRGMPATLATWRLRWCLIAGSLAFVAQYPRLDTFHLAWSAPLLLVLAGVVLSQAHAHLARRWRLPRPGAALLAGGLSSLVLLAALPAVYLRLGVLYASAPQTGWPERTWMVPLDRPPLVSGFFLDAAAAYQLRDVLAYLNTRTAPGEAIFVYPSSPLLYVLADRPNPTRYSHIYPGLSSADQQRVLDSLAAADVRTVVVSDAWLDFWGTQPGNPLIQAYLAGSFQEQAVFGVYRVLGRR